MESFYEGLRATLGPLYGTISLALAAGAVFVFFLIVGRILSAGLERVVPTGAGRSPSANLVRRGIRWTFAIVGVVLGLQILGLTAVATSLLATGGLVAVILGFAFREIGENLLAGVFLGMSRSFEVGDLVESSGHSGRVRDIDLRHVHLRAADGRDLFIPSAQILRNVLVNFTRDGLRRGEFQVGVDYGDPIPEAEALLLKTAQDIPKVLDQPPVAVRLTAFTPQYVELQVQFWINTDEGSDLGQIRTAVMHECLRALKEQGFTLSSSVSTAVSLSPVEITVRDKGG